MTITDPALWFPVDLLCIKARYPAPNRAGPMGDVRVMKTRGGKTYFGDRRETGREKAPGTVDYLHYRGGRVDWMSTNG